MATMEAAELPDGRKVRLTRRVLENIDDHDDCPFCLGRAAAHRDDDARHNPFPVADSPRGSIEWYESDYGLWATGYAAGSAETGGLRP